MRRFAARTTKQDTGGLSESCLNLKINLMLSVRDDKTPHRRGLGWRVNLSDEVVGPMQPSSSV